MNSFYCFSVVWSRLGWLRCQLAHYVMNRELWNYRKEACSVKLLLSIRNHQILRYYLRYEHIRLMFDIIAAFYYKLLTIKRKKEAGGIGRLNNNRYSVRISSPTSWYFGKPWMIPLIFSTRSKWIRNVSNSLVDL